MFLHRIIIRKVFSFGILFLAIFPTFLMSSVVFASAEDALKTLRGRQLSPQELDSIWNSEVVPLKQAKSPLLGEVYQAYRLQIEGLINNQGLLNGDYNSVMQAIEHLPGNNIRKELEFKLATNYTGATIDPMLNLLGETYDPVTMLEILVQKGQLTQGKVKDIWDIMFASKYFPQGRTPRVLESLAKHYTGPVRDLLSIEYLNEPIGIHLYDTLAVYKGLLENQLLRAQAYPLIANYTYKVMASAPAIEEPKISFINDLVNYYVAGNSEELFKDILALEKALSESRKRMDALKKIYWALVTKANYCAEKGDTIRESELRTVYRKLQEAYPGIESGYGKEGIK